MPLVLCDDQWIAAITKQASTLQHISNCITILRRSIWLKNFVNSSGFSKSVFNNSGAEANECAIKLARKYSTDKYNENRTKIITLVNSFHGRNGLQLWRQQVRIRSIIILIHLRRALHMRRQTISRSVKSLLDENTCAVFIEMIQGEGGVMPLETSFCKRTGKAVQKHDVPLMVDEVKTGMEGTGTLFCYEQYGIEPDVITSSKALGGGLPIGACLCTERLGSRTEQRGMHGSTFEVETLFTNAGA